MKLIALLIMIAFITIGMTFPLNAQTYEIEMLTYDTWFNLASDINDNGWVTFRAGASQSDIFLYDGLAIRQITNDLSCDNLPQINDNGQIVWRAGIGNTSEIFFFDGISTKQITTDASVDWFPLISNNGYIAWQTSGSSGEFYDNEIMLYDGFTIKQLSDNMVSDDSVAMNDIGWVAWRSDTDHGSGIMLYDGVTTKQITNNASAGTAPAINDNGWVAWKGYNGLSYCIFLYDGSTIKQIEDNLYNVSGIVINNNGYVAWQSTAADGNNADVYLYNGTEVKKLTDNPHNDSHLQINDNNYLIWDGGLQADQYDSIYVYDGYETQRIIYPDGYTYFNSSAQINNDNQISWTAIYDNNYNIFIANPVISPDEYESNRKKFIITTQPDTNGNVYRHFIDENWNNENRGRVDKEVKQVADSDGSIAYEYFYHENSNVVRIKNCYETADYNTDPSNASLSDLSATYEYDISGALTRRAVYDRKEERKFVAEQISEPSNNWRAWAMLNDGQVAWFENDGNGWDLFLYDGTGVQQLADTDYVDVGYPQIDNGQMVWSATSSNVGADIFFYDGEKIVRLTDNDFGDLQTSVDNGKVAWFGYDGNDLEVFLYDGVSVTPLTNNAVDDYHCTIDNGQVVWQSGYGNGSEIFFFDGAKTVQLTNNTYLDQYPTINNGQIAWGADVSVGNGQIFFYDGTSTKQISDSNFNSSDSPFPIIDNGQVVWRGFDGHDWEMFFFDGAKTIQLTNDEYDVSHYSLDNGRIVWDSYDGTNWQIFLYDGSTITQLTDTTCNNVGPQISGDQIMWGVNNLSVLGTELMLGEFKTTFIDYVRYVYEYESGRLTLTKEYDFTGALIKETYADGTTHAYDPKSNRKKYIISIKPDVNGNIYSHYLDENWGGQGHGRADKEVREVADSDGSVAYEYFYHENSNVVRIKYAYGIADYNTDPSNLILSDLIATYEYNGNGVRVKKILSDGTTILYHENENNRMHTKRLPDGAEYEYDDTGGDDNGTPDDPSDDHGRLIKEKKIDGLRTEYSDFDDTNKPGCIKEYDAAGNLSKKTVYHKVETGWIAEPTHITNLVNSYSGQDLDNGQVVWHAYDGHDYEIFFYDGSTTIQLTNNDYDDVYPLIDNGQVVWNANPSGGSCDIFFYDGSSVKRLTDNAMRDEGARIKDGKVVWYGQEAPNSILNVFLYDSVSGVTTKLNGTTEGNNVTIDNGQAAWLGTVGGYYEIFFYDGSKPIQLTKNNYNENAPQVDGGQVVWWTGSAGTNDSEIYLYNGTSVIRLTDNNYRDIYPVFDNGQVVWTGWDGADSDIFFYDGARTIKLTDNDINDDIWVNIEDGRVLWASYDGNDYELFMYDGISTVQLTNNDHDDRMPWISGNQILWTSDGELVLGTFGTGYTDYKYFVYEYQGGVIYKERCYTSGDICEKTIQYWASGKKYREWIAEGLEGDDVYREYDSEEKLVKKTLRNGEDITYHSGSGRIKSKTLANPDGDGCTYYEYLDEDYNGQGFGKISKKQKSDGSYESMEYWDNSDKIKTHKNFDTTGREIESKEYDSEGNLNSKTYNYESNKKKYIISIKPDVDGNIYRHYLDEDWGGKGNGRPDKEVKEVVDINGAKAYEYFYHENSNVVRIKYAYETADYNTDPSNIFLSDLIATYEYDTNGRVTTKVLGKANADGELVFDYVYFQGQDKVQYVDTFADVGRTEKLARYEYDGSNNLVRRTVYDRKEERKFVPDQITSNDYIERVIGFFDGQAVWLKTNIDFWAYNGTATLHLTEGPYSDPVYIIFDKGQAVWNAEASVSSGRGGEIFFYDGTQTIRLTDNTSRDEQPHISDGKIVWYGERGGRLEVFLYDSATGATTNFSNNSLYEDYHCDIHNNQIVWVSAPGGSAYDAGAEIYLNNGTTTTRLTNNSIHDDYPVIHDGQVIWISTNNNGATWDLYFYDGDSTIMLDTDIEAHSDKINSGLVTWSTFDGVTREYFLYTGSTTIQLPMAPVMNNGQAVWAANDGHDNEIFLYDGTEVVQVTDNNNEDNAPFIDNGKIVWSAYDGNNWQIYLYDGRVITQLTDAPYNNLRPMINGDHIMWAKCPLVTSDTELMRGEFKTTFIDYVRYVYEYESGKLILTKEYDATGALIKETYADGETHVYDPESKRKKYIISIKPDVNGNIYRHYLDEDWGGQGHGRPDKEVKEVVDINGAKAYEYFYHENSNVVRIKYCYEFADYTTDPSNVTFSDKVATYEYDLKGRVTTMILEHSNAYGELVFEFEYDGETDKVKHKHSYKDAEKKKKDKDYEYDEDGHLTTETVYEETKTGWIAEPAYGANNLVAPGSIVDFYDGKMVFFNYSTSIQYVYDVDTGVMESHAVPIQVAQDPYRQFDRNQIVWQGFYSLTAPTAEIFFWNGTQTIQLTNNNISDEFPRISNGKITWFNTRSNDDVFLYDGNQVRNLTSNNSLLQQQSDVLDNYITWVQYDQWPAPGDIFLHDGSNTIRITNDSVNDGAALLIGDGKVLWSRQGDVGYDLYAYNGSGVTKLCDNFEGNASSTKYGDGWVVWQASDGSDKELYLYDGTKTIQLTNNNYDDSCSNVSVGGGLVVWAELDGHDGELYLYDGKEKAQLTNNDYLDNYPWISGNQIGWMTTGNKLMFGEFGICGITKTIYEYNSEGKLKKKTNENGDVETYHGSGRKESLTLSQPDASGNTYYHYIDEDWNGQNCGRVDQRIASTINSNGEIAFKYRFGSGVLNNGQGGGWAFGIKSYMYAYSDVSLNNLVATYEVDVNGSIIQKVNNGPRKVKSQPIYMPRGDGEAASRMGLESTLTQGTSGTHYTQSGALANSPDSRNLLPRL